MRIVTTSWDDGFESSLKIAELLEKFDLKGTFYVPVNTQGMKDLTEEGLKKLSENFEVGGHGFTHNVLTELSKREKEEEIQKSKEELSELVGQKIRGFAYPKGYYDEETIEILKRKEFKYARTVEDGELTISKKYEMPVTCFCGTHFIQRVKFSILAPFHDIYPFLGNWVDGILKAYERLKETGGVLHIAGHGQNWSEDFRDKLNNAFSEISGNPNIDYLSNWGVIKSLKLA